METLYKKIGKKYISAGVSSDIDIYPGIWYVVKDKSSTSLRLIRVADTIPMYDSQLLVSINLVFRTLTDYLYQKIKDNELKIFDKSIGEIEFKLIESYISNLFNNEFIEKFNKMSTNDSFTKSFSTEIAQKIINEIQNPSKKYTWHQLNLTSLDILFGELSEKATLYLGQTYFQGILHELKTRLNNQFELDKK